MYLTHRPEYHSVRAVRYLVRLARRPRRGPRRAKDGFARIRAFWTNHITCWSEDLANHTASCSNALTQKTPRAVKSSWSRAMMLKLSKSTIVPCAPPICAKLYCPLGVIFLRTIYSFVLPVETCVTPLSFTKPMQTESSHPDIPTRSPTTTTPTHPV